MSVLFYKAMDKEKKKIGLFFGSFNPVHIGHMAIANYMLEFTNLDQVWFVVSPHNPFKEKRTLLAEYHRLELVNLAIGDNMKMKATNIEFRLPKPSFTIDTLTYLTEKYPLYHFVLIMGSDSMPTFNKWKNYKQILKYYYIYVYPRIGFEDKIQLKHPSIKYFKAPVIDISSSFIRNAIKKRKDIRYFLPEKVNNYIQEMHFYEK